MPANTETGAKRSTPQRALLLLGSLGPCGHAPASGTVTVAVVGIPLYLLLHPLPLAASIAVTLAVTLASVWIHQVGDRLLGEKDSRKLVWDEVVGYLIAMTAVPATWQLILIGFLVERAIDIAKVFPANVAERRLPGGWGVVADDVVAGLYTLGILHLIRLIAPTLAGVG